MKRSAVALGGAALMLSATIGFSQAQTQSATQQRHQAVIDLAATQLGLTSDPARAAAAKVRAEARVDAFVTHEFKATP